MEKNHVVLLEHRSLRRRIAKLLQREGHRIGFDRAYRLWRRAGLKVARRRKEKHCLCTSNQGCVRQRVERRNYVWAWDFVFESINSGSSLKWLAIIDEHTRECLALMVSRRIRHTDVVDVLRGLFVAHGVPEHIRSGNGPEFIATGLREWLVHSGVGPLSITPGSPWENGYAESFNSRLRDEFLGCEVFDDVPSAQALGTAWRVPTTNGVLTVRWGTVLPLISRRRVLLPFRLRLCLSLHSCNTRPYKPDSHYHWTKELRHSRATSRVTLIGCAAGAQPIISQSRSSTSGCKLICGTSPN